MTSADAGVAGGGVVAVVMVGAGVVAAALGVATGTVVVVATDVLVGPAAPTVLWLW